MEIEKKLLALELEILELRKAMAGRAGPHGPSPLPPKPLVKDKVEKVIELTVFDIPVTFKDIKSTRDAIERYRPAPSLTIKTDKNFAVSFNLRPVGYRWHTPGSDKRFLRRMFYFLAKTGYVAFDDKLFQYVKIRNIPNI